jgi:hypothetical protein
MDVRAFSRLNMRQRLQWVYFEGQYVMAIRYYEYKVILYLLKDFYVEVFYHNNESEIKKVEVFDYRSSRANFYTDQIRLSEELS